MVESLTPRVAQSRTLRIFAASAFQLSVSFSICDKSIGSLRVTMPVGVPESKPSDPASGFLAAESWRRWYFPVVSISILLLSLIAFGDNLFTDIGQPSNSQPHFVIHGVFCLAWMTLLVVQSLLVSQRRLATHRRMGTVGSIIALGVIASTLWLFVMVWKGWDAMPFFVKANRILSAAFVVAVGLAIYWRRRPLLHRRLMLLATIFTLQPVLDRAADHLALNTYVFSVLVWNALFLSLFAYDRITTRQWQRVTIAGVTFFYTTWVAAVLL
jgi:hypothetical protein